MERSPDTTLVKRSRPNIPSRYHSLLPPPDPAAPSPVYYEINVSDKGFLPTRARSVPEDTSSATDLTLSLDFEKTTCPRKDVVKVSCEGLQCGMRPRAVHHRARWVEAEVAAFERFRLGALGRCDGETQGLWTPVLLAVAEIGWGGGGSVTKTKGVDFYDQGRRSLSVIKTRGSEVPRFALKS